MKDFISVTIRKTTASDQGDKTEILYEQKFSYPDRINDNDIYSLIAELNSVNDLQKAD